MAESRPMDTDEPAADVNKAKHAMLTTLAEYIRSDPMFCSLVHSLVVANAPRAVPDSPESPASPASPATSTDSSESSSSSDSSESAVSSDGPSPPGSPAGAVDPDLAMDSDPGAPVLSDVPVACASKRPVSPAPSESRSGAASSDLDDDGFTTICHPWHTPPNVGRRGPTRPPSQGHRSPRGAPDAPQIAFVTTWHTIRDGPRHLGYPADVKALYELRDISGLGGFTVETPHKTSEVAQCHNCQKYGHNSRGCRLPARCVKCLGEHGTSECPRPKDRSQCTEPPSCTNCRQSGHPANYRGCPRAPKYKSNYRTNQAPKAKAPQAEKFVLAPAPTRNPWFPATVRADSRPQAQGGGSPGGSPATPATTPAAAATVPAPVPTPSTSKATSSKVVKSKAPAPSKPQVAATPASSGAASSFSLVSPRDYRTPRADPRLLVQNEGTGPL
ncbi:vegetative cell wall protein gp1-like [Manduca sexta]|uniref:vegetative cell wall protein gp1-like n=1 Tax=Manduca sexta TaxID=7130 RepID=UPI0018907BC3|nr:vegetative cell wall protein gp1-like [Manduca sexta]